jgi:hypothetical protein
MGSHHALPVTFTLSVSLFMLARKRPAVGSIRTLELDGKTYTKLNEGGRNHDVCRGPPQYQEVAAAVCLLVRT